MYTVYVYMCVFCAKHIHEPTFRALCTYALVEDASNFKIFRFKATDENRILDTFFGAAKAMFPVAWITEFQWCGWTSLEVCRSSPMIMTYNL